MDIQREREVFEKLPEIARHINKFVFQDDLNCYRNKIKSSDIHLVTWVNGAWYSWQAKALAVPEENALLSATLDAVQKLGSGEFVLLKNDSKTIVAIEQMVEQQVEASGMDSRCLERLDGGENLTGCN